MGFRIRLFLRCVMHCLTRLFIPFYHRHCYQP